ncbi:glycoside hydrolase family 2 protein [Brevibacillus dissolubilis]|uniref:glycoside hydrolase family 2 protein n=1 Tax=Brevibacillus dissolubilis TaxID=1844116 RepID=UPI0011161F4E|nr:glycoside hydrolase family 2 protein [Brevibacillus dissolubilis]
MTRIQSITTYRQTDLLHAWELAETAVGEVMEPAGLANLALRWLPAQVPGTVASSLQATQLWDSYQHKNLDASDWWYRCRFSYSQADKTQMILQLKGLASIADVWLNGTLLLSTDNMFREYETEITSQLLEDNELYLHFHSLQALLDKKHPRPMWKTRLVNDQHLRWYRTTLLGRMPGWTPPIRAVGPWMPILIEERPMRTIENFHVTPTVVGSDGIVACRVTVNLADQDDQPLTHAVLMVCDCQQELSWEKDGHTLRLSGELRIADVELWWPHTHGEQPLYEVGLALHFPDQTMEVVSHPIGFRQIELPAAADPDLADFTFQVNGCTVFCRGANWTTLDINTLSASPEQLRHTLTMVRDAGMNMLRLSGTMIYESDAFYQLCDELGIMVWQDFMFSNMDYPVQDEAFMTNVEAEVRQVLNRLQSHPSLALLCGNNEVEQQASMLGLPRETWSNHFFSKKLPALCAEYSKGVPYWPSSPSGGVLPFHPNHGNSHYQAPGAFLHPLEDARRAEVRFATECVTFANIPEDHTIDLFINPGELSVLHPRWKMRTMRDNGVGWDFEEIRDHYMTKLFAADPTRLRYSNMERYLALGRVTPGEVMTEVFADWRRADSTCQGGLVWFLQDFLPGAGWGVIDATGYPKSAYYYLKRAFAPTAIFFADEVMSGLYLHAVNEKPEVLTGTLHIGLYRYQGGLVAEAKRDLTVLPRQSVSFSVDECFDGFRDLTYAYRFGPPAQDFIVATLYDQAGQLVSDCFYFPCGRPHTQENDIGVEATAEERPDGTYLLTVTSKKFAQAVAIKCTNFLPDHNYFHMEPDGQRQVVLSKRTPNAQLRGSVQPLNASNPTRITIRQGVLS